MTTAADSNQTERVFRAIEALEADAVQALRDAVQIPSLNPSYPGLDPEAVRGQESAAARFVSAIHRQAGAEVELYAAAPGRENAIGVIRGSGGGQTLLLNGHVDVVPPGDPAAWTGGDPFSGELRDGRVWGRGSADMKAGVLAQAFAARALHDAGIRLRGDLVLNAVVGEEMGEHAIGTSAALARGPRPDVAIVAEPTGDETAIHVAPVSPACLMFSVTIRGKAAHCGTRGTTIRAGGRGAEIGVNAIDKAFLIYRALRELEDSWGLTKSHPLFEPGFFSLLPGVVVGGPEGVMSAAFLADVTRIEYSCWYPPTESGDAIKAEIEQQIAHAAALDPWLREHPPTVEYTLDFPAADVPVDHPAIAVLQRAHAAAAVGTAVSGPAELQAFRAVSDATWLNQQGVPALVYGPGDAFRGNIHGVDEYVAVDSYLTAIRTFALAAIELCGAER